MTEITPEKVAAALCEDASGWRHSLVATLSVTASRDVLSVDVVRFDGPEDSETVRHFWAVVVEGETVPDLAEVDRLRAKLDAPCGSCHPCTNYADETWRAAGRTPPHVYQWDETRTEVDRLTVRLQTAEAVMRKALTEVEHEEVVHLLNRYFAAAEAAQAEQERAQ